MNALMQKLKARFVWPWAPRSHHHHQYTDRLSMLVHDATCHGCGHLVLNGHVSNWRVSIHDGAINRGRIYGASCKPNYNHVESTPDERWLYYLKGEDGSMVQVKEPDILMDESPEGQALNRRAAPPPAPAP